MVAGIYSIMRELPWILLILTLVSGLTAHPDGLKSVLEDIVKRLDEKEARIRQLEENTKVQTAIVNELTSIVNQHEQTINELRNTISQYERTTRSQQQRITVLEEDMMIQKLMIEELQAPEEKDPSDTELHNNEDGDITVNTPKGAIGQSNRHVGATRRNLIQKRDTENPVAFLVTLTDHAENMGEGQNIAFDNVITNIGDAYNSHAGVFIAPVSGIYVFSATIFSYRQTNSHYAFYKNGVLVTRMFYHGDTILAYDTTSSTVTLQLSKGDDVSVVNQDLDKDVAGGHYTSFTGFLLQEIYDGTTVVGK